jgi:hypothetical protein
MTISSQLKVRTPRADPCRNDGISNGNIAGLPGMMIRSRVLAKSKRAKRSGEFSLQSQEGEAL